MKNSDLSNLLARLASQPMSRREALRLGLAGAAGWMALGGLGARAMASAATQPTQPAKAKAKAVIQIWMWGGPSQLDTFDPKPEAGDAYCGPLKSPIETNVSGIRIGESLPLLAKQADKYSIIRSMTHGNNGHETAAYMVQTGRPPGERLVYPCVGAVVSLFKGEAVVGGLLPPYIVLTEPQGRFSESGFLGGRYKPFATGGDPNQTRFNVEGIVAQGITDKRQEDRRELMHKLDALDRTMAADGEITTARAAEKQAYELILGDGSKTFDLSQEKAELRDQYGRTKFGQSCLMARRLVERGVPYITINYNGWDTHKQHFQAMRRLLPDFDKGFSTLLADLAGRGLLDSTVVWCCGEFGRTPKIMWEEPWNGGRGHWGNCFSAVVAGGGFKGGRVVGQSDARGEQVKDRPVYPVDLLAGIYELIGIDPAGNLPNPQGVPARVTAAEGEGVKIGGRLKEIL